MAIGHLNDLNDQNTWLSLRSSDFTVCFVSPRSKKSTIKWFRLRIPIMEKLSISLKEKKCDQHTYYDCCNFMSATEKKKMLKQ